MKTFRNILAIAFIAAGALMPMAASAQLTEGVFPAVGTPSNPKVEATWNHYYDYAGITELTNRIAKAHPDLVRRQSIGKSVEGREMWVLTISNFKNGDPDKKPAIYIDGNIHSNEIQGTEVALYTAWYLTESFGDVEFITELLNDKTFYIVPTINPDAREHFMKAANNANSPRSGVKPIDNDGDGVANEDVYDDLNNDGHITTMIRKNPRGEFKKHPNNPNVLVRVGPDEFGDYERLGYEGLDNDGDGRINEDGIAFSYDPNRDWGWNWQPDYIQRGAMKYPFSLPETRNVMEFAMSHPNIAAAQSYHNAGGMILRGPGAEEDRSTYNRADSRVYDAIGEKGERLIPGYRYLVVYDDLYTVFGGELDWFYGIKGVFTYSNELFTPYEYYNEQGASRGDQSLLSEFDRDLLFGDGIVEWETYNHPQYGEIEIGGPKKQFGRAHPGFLLEQMAHRNMAFTIFHAYHTPKLTIDEITEKDLGGGLKEVTAVVTNERMIPTHAGIDTEYKITRPDLIKIEGARVEAGMIVDNRDFNQTTEQPQNPAVIEVENIAGMSSVTVRWIISSGRNYTVTVDSKKGGIVSMKKS